jgi:hypothetical protein
MYIAKHKDAPKGFEVKANNIKEARENLLESLGWTVTMEKEVDYSIYHQRNERYKGVKLGDGNFSFQLYGCFVCSLAFLAGKDPLDVNKLLAEKGGMTKGGLVISDKAAEILGLDLLKGNHAIPGKMTDIGYMPKFTSIKEVTLGRSQHFVVRIYDEGRRSIYDPWTNKFLPINHYPFRSYRLFKVK